MSITTKSQFYYGHTIDSDNYALDFDEGGGELQASLNFGSYTLTEFATEVARAMNEAGGQTYSVSVNRTTRKLTISASSAFTLLTSSGSRSGTAVWSLLGFNTGSDTSSSTSHTGDNASGSRYRPQSVLTEYRPFDDAEEDIKSKTHISGSGRVRVVRFGRAQFMECNIKYISDLDQSGNPNFDTDANARANARDFLTYISKKRKVEFMEDRDTPGTYTTCILESAQGNRKGTGFELDKMFDEGVANYFESGRMTFRKVT